MGDAKIAYDLGAVSSQGRALVRFPSGPPAAQRATLGTQLILSGILHNQFIASHA